MESLSTKSPFSTKQVSCLMNNDHIKTPSQDYLYCLFNNKYSVWVGKWWWCDQAGMRSKIRTERRKQKWKYNIVQSLNISEAEYKSQFTLKENSEFGKKQRQEKKKHNFLPKTNHIHLFILVGILDRWEKHAKTISNSLFNISSCFFF